MKVNKKYLLLGSFIGILALSVNCGGGGSGGGAPQINSIDELPSIMSPLAGSSSSSLVSALASTGMLFGSTTSASFTSGSAMSACETYNHMAEVVRHAVFPDAIKCFANVIGTGDAAISAAAQAGETFAFGLDTSAFDAYTGCDDCSGPDHIRFNVDLDGNDLVEGYTMWSCKNGTLEQYESYTVDGSSVTIVSKGVYTNEEEGLTDLHEMTVTGTLTELSGGIIRFSDRVIEGWFDRVSNYEDGWGYEKLTQESAAAFEAEGYMSGTHMDGGVTYTNTNAVAVFGQYMSAEAVDDQGIGDGAIKVNFSGSGGGGTWSDTFVESWDGDTTQAVSSNDFTSQASSATLPSKSEPSLGINPGDPEYYGCNDTEITQVDMADYMATIMIECGDLIQMEHDWINCWSIMGSNYE